MQREREEDGHPNVTRIEIKAIAHIGILQEGEIHSEDVSKF